jgi:CheY-like chemotaxis protein
VVDKKAIRLREQILPVAALADILGLTVEKPAQNRHLTIVMAMMGNEKMGLIVDALATEEDMEIKPLPPHMKNLELVAGAGISGKNEIVLLLHVPGMFARAREIKKVRPTEKIGEEARKGKLILVIDDSVNTREIEKNILESYGYNVHLAMDGQDGYAKAMQTQYDLIVTDIEMPRLDGFSLTEKLRQEHGYKHTPIIIVTSRDKDEDKRRGITVGANAYIVKGSFEQSNLLDTVQSLIA